MLRQATLKNYIDWLDRFVSNGGIPTHYYDYNWSRTTWAIALDDFTMGGECGANAINIIIMPGCEPFGHMGHNKLFFMGGNGAHSGRWIPVFSDPEFDFLNDIPGFIRGPRVFDTVEQSERRYPRSDVSKFTGR